jgi:Ser/Thr protein kinase RdoA (MazF antagonist)
LEGELSQVLRCFGLGELQAASRVERGFVDENWIVETERGRYFLKRRHPRRRQSEQVIQAQHELIEHLRRVGFPAPILVPAATGESFLALEGEVYELEEYIEGGPYQPDRPEHLTAAARTLGRYHTCVEGFARQALRARGQLYCPENWQAILTRLREAWQLDRDEGLARIARHLESLVRDLASRYAEHGELSHLVIHGDYYAGNLLFDGDRVVGVVDYDKSSWQPRVAELAEALIYFASPRPGHLRYLVYPGFLVWEPFSRFVQGYAGLITLDEDEARALPDYVWCIWSSVSLWRLLERAPSRPPEARAALQEVLALANWARANASRMSEVVCQTKRKESP